MRAATALVVLAALAPWLAILPLGRLDPLGGAAAAAAGALALTAAMHGAGLLLARLAGRPDVHPLLAIWWGAAALIGLLGLAIAAGVAGLATQAVLVYGFAAVHTAALALRLPAYGARLAAARRTRRAWLVPAALLAAIAAVHVLGAAGESGARPFDDDGHVPAQLERLRQTGALGDPIGYARQAQLGGQLALQALAAAGGDASLGRLAEALAFVLAVGLALARLGRPGEADAVAGLWRLLLVLAAAAFTYVRPDPSACWTAVGLILALHATLAERAGDHGDGGDSDGDGDGTSAMAAAGSALPAGVLAGALVTLRIELAPVAAAAIAAAWWPRRDRVRDLSVLAAGALAVVAPYAVARILAWSDVPAAARALVEPLPSPLGARLAIGAGVVAACAPLVAACWRAAALRWLAAGAALAIGGIAGQLTGALPYAATFLWPIAIAGGIVLAIEVARDRRITTAALLASLCLALFIYEGRAATGRRRWARRYITLAENIEYLRRAGDAPPGGYAPLFAGVPAGAVVAVSVTRPERLDLAARYHIVDLRTPRAAWTRAICPPLATGTVAPRLAALGADFLLFEAEGAPPPRCTDELAALARDRPAIAEAGGARLVDLRGALHPP